MKLVLGTAQFGLDYGVTNTSGKVNRHKVHKILETAKSYGITTLDTAIAYGDSEQVLGECCAEINGFEFISKLTIDSGHFYSVIEEIEGSCYRLEVRELYAVMIHNVDCLLESRSCSIWNDLERAKFEGRVKKIGVSVYNPEQAKKILENYDIDIIQIPFNLLDQRFKQSGLFEIFKLKDIEVHVRSIFLQGLLLSNYSRINEYFQPIQPKLSLIDQMCAENNMSKLEVVFSQLNTIKEIDAVVFGVTSIDELMEVISTFYNYKKKSEHDFFDSIAVLDERFVNPTLWPDFQEMKIE